MTKEKLARSGHVLVEFYRERCAGLVCQRILWRMYLQSVADRKLILEEVMAVAKGKLTIIAHVARNNTKDSVELARHAEELGVDAIAGHSGPIYFPLARIQCSPLLE